MSKYIRAESYKCRHTAVKKLIVLMPLFTTVLSVWLTHEYFVIDSYNWWYINMFSVMTALVCGGLMNREKKMENRAVRVLPVDMGKVWDAKVFYGIFCVGISLLALLLCSMGGAAFMKAGLHMNFTIEPTKRAQIAAVLLLWISAWWQIPFCMLLLQKIGFLPMMIVHVGLYAISAVGMSLKSLFFLFPGAIGARIMCAVLRVLPNGLPAEPGMMTFSPELLEMRNIWTGLTASAVWFLVFWLIGRVLYERQVKG